MRNGPYCQTCMYFSAWAGHTSTGQCNDPAKIIRLSSGGELRGAPETREFSYCVNHTTLEQELDRLRWRA